MDRGSMMARVSDYKKKGTVDEQAVVHASFLTHPYAIHILPPVGKFRWDNAYIKTICLQNLDCQHLQHSRDCSQ